MIYPLKWLYKFQYWHLKHFILNVDWIIRKVFLLVFKISVNFNIFLNNLQFKILLIRKETKKQKHWPWLFTKKKSFCLKFYFSNIFPNPWRNLIIYFKISIFDHFSFSFLNLLRRWKKEFRFFPVTRQLFKF